MATRASGLQNITTVGNKSVLQYNAAEDRFKLVNSDDILTKASEDGNISDTFVSQVEDQIATENITIIELDGGGF